MKRVISILVCLVLVASTGILASCDIISNLQNAVKYPDSYSLTYELTSAEGTISTITKTVDAYGNVYYRNADEETVYIREGAGYIKYEKNGEGDFESTTGVKLTKSAMENETSGICEYAEKSMNKFMPTAKQESNTEMFGRACEVYKLGVGDESNGSYHYYYVDAETGICLGVEVKNTALGNIIAYDGEGFICTEFLVGNIDDISNMIAD